ncbi:spore coat protein CotJB [Paenibacillus sp.]|uniref:spore coat protein CotJB n=1 Tax=Paenibacillus sp. TaxID=58172 RepID=UPI0028123BB9|nr:spore coat protein CotJB [Paenibacillus sp.]
MTHSSQWKEDDWKTYYDLMRQMQETDFVLVELNLYLDTHPDDQAAIAQFNQYVQRSMAIKHQFQSMFGPLYHFGVSYSPMPFAWKEAPWPWQV